MLTGGLFMNFRRLSTLVALCALITTAFFASAARADVFTSDLSAAGTTATMSPSIASDKDDYQPGETVHLLGARWQPSETVHIVVNDTRGATWTHVADVTADVSGAITDDFTLPNWFVADYDVTATGTSSGATATTTFTDASIAVSFPVEGASYTPASWTTDLACPSPICGTAGGGGVTKAEISIKAPGAGGLWWDGSSFSSSTQRWFDLGVGSLGGGQNANWQYAFAATNFPVSGTYTITAHTLNSTNNENATVSRNFSMELKQNQTISFDPPTPKTFGDADFGITATATSGLAVSLATSSSACSLSGSTVHIISAGDCVITASQAGNTSYNAGPDVTKTIVINKADQTITFDPPATKTVGDDDFTVGASSTSGLTVALTGNTPSVCTLSGNTVHIVAAGTCSITASQAGDGNYFAAQNVTRLITIEKKTQTITFDAPTGTEYGDADFDPGATAGSGLAVSYSSTTPSVCTIVSNNVRIVSAGTCTVTAAQSGNATWAAASDVTRYVTIGKKSLNVTASSPADIAYGDAEPASHPIYDGFVLGEDETDLGSEPTCDSDYAAGDAPDSYTTSCAGGSSDNYAFNFISGGFDVTKRALTAHVSDEQMTYGGSVPSFSVVSFTGFILGDGESDVDGTLSCDSSNHNAGGPYAVTCSGLTSDKYDISYDDGSLTIAKATLNVDAANQSKTYGDPDPTPTYTFSGYQGTDDADSVAVGGSASCSYESHSEDAGTYSDVITCGPGSLSSANYLFQTGGKGTLTIDKASQSITFAQPGSQAIGSTFDPGATASSNLAVSYTASPASVCEATSDHSQVHMIGLGTCDITASQAGNGNYLAATPVTRSVAAVYRWDGFLQPINDTAHTGLFESRFKTGSTIPVKFQIKNSAGVPQQQSTTATFQRGSNRGACDAWTNVETVVADAPTNDGIFRWDSTLQGYIYNFSTKGLSAGEYRIYANLADGTKQYVDICLTR
jgi:hypothetical protein